MEKYYIYRMEIHKDINTGDVVMCNEELPYITKNNFYGILEIFKGIDNNIYCQIIDDDNYINSYKLSSFISLQEIREKNIFSVLK